MQELMQGLDKDNAVLNEVVLASTLSFNQKITEEINKNKWQTTIFKSLSDTSNLPTLLKDVGKDALGYFVELFKNTCIDTSAEAQFTLMLKDILTELPTKYSTEFIYEFFMPLVNSYKSVPVVLQPYSRDEKIYLARPNKILEKEPLKVNNYRNLVSKKFISSDVKNVINKIGDFWIPADAADFPNTAKVFYIES